MRDLEGFITAMGWSGVRAVGHSAGATAIGSLACECPDLISRAVLVEPVIFESATAPELGWRSPFIERTLKRRRIFDSVEAMYLSFHNKPPYSTWQKDILRDYCQFGTRPTSDGKRELKCAPEVEAKFYETSRDFDGLGADSPLHGAAVDNVRRAGRFARRGAVRKSREAAQERTRDRCRRRRPFYADGNAQLRRGSGERVPDV